ncbi:MAG: dihydrofolate reductase [Chitinivibrionales bacterium]|nr:dihydrofolate reductase [Chitinivibrionales bacterium]MBD3356703.1 dihydrofolate reductase [Chitinivibrionales bacterium]
MTEIIIIAAVARNGVIGKSGRIPWSIREDFLHVKEKTLGHPCIMGVRTYESLPDFARPLPGRQNIVLTSERGYRAAGATVVHSFEEAVDHVRISNAKKAFIFGGAGVYRKALPVADTLELTKIERDYDGDVTFPAINFDNWEETAREKLEAEDRRTGEIVRLSFCTYRRKVNDPTPV